MCARACVMGRERGGALAGQRAAAVCETFVTCELKQSCVRNTTDRPTVAGRSARACAIELSGGGNASRRSGGAEAVSPSASRWFALQRQSRRALARPVHSRPRPSGRLLPAPRRSGPRPCRHPLPQPTGGSQTPAVPSVPHALPQLPGRRLAAEQAAVKRQQQQNLPR